MNDAGIHPWLCTLYASLNSKQLSPLGEVLPDFPSEELQRNTTGLSSEAALQQAHHFYQDVTDAIGKSGRRLCPESQVLDFGFGWGRISRVFMHDVRKENIYGVDVDPEFVELTRRLFGSENFNACPPFPPTAYPDASFDLIYAYSVFSHLSEEACRSWMVEFERLLKPGGMVAFTTRHESFFDYCAFAATQPDATGYTAALGQLFPDIDDARRRYRAGELVHATSQGVAGGGPRNSSFYGETWIPEAYVRSGMGSGLRMISASFDASRYDQACFVLQRIDQASDASGHGSES